MHETIGNRIQKYRKARGMTQEELAGKVGVSSQAVSKWENDASCPDISLLPQLCKLLGVTSDELLTGKSHDVGVVFQKERKPLDELTLRIKVSCNDGDRVRVNVPMALVKVCMEMGVDVVSTVNGSETAKNIDFDKILRLVEQGAIGKLMEIESSSGDTVEIVVE